MKWKGNKMKLKPSLIGFLCLFAFCNAPPDAFAPPPTIALRVALTPTNTVLIAWPSVYSSASLLQKSDIGGTNWDRVLKLPTLVGNEYQVIVAPNDTNCFYRLRVF